MYGDCRSMWSLAGYVDAVSQELATHTSDVWRAELQQQAHLR